MQHKQMLLTTSTSVQLSYKYNKILHFCPTIQNNYVMLAIKHHRTQVLSYLDQKGKVLLERVFHDADLQQMGMVGENTVILLHPKQHLIIQWNIQTNTFIQVPYLFKNQQALDTYNLYLFPQSNSFCIVQIGNADSKIFRLSYFYYPLQKSEDEPFLVFDDDEVWSPKNIVRKGNNHSMVIWFDSQDDIQSKIQTFDFKDNSDGEYNQYVLSECKGLEVDFDQMEISIGNAWQIRPKEFLLVCITNETYDKKQNVYPNSNLVFNVKQQSLRKSNFTFEGKYQNQIVDSYHFGNTSILKSYDFIKGVACLTPVYFIHNQTEQIIAQQVWKCSHLNKYQFLAHRPNTLIECEYDNGHVDRVVIHNKQIMDDALINTFMMSSLIQNCDQDLMYYTIHLTNSS